MTTLPLKDDLAPVGAGNAGPTRAALRQLHDWLRELLGGETESTLGIVAGAVTPTRAVHSVDTEGLAGADDLTTITTTNHPDGRLLLLRCANAARVVTVKHNAGGAGQVALADSADFVLNNTTKWLLVKRTGADWQEVTRSFGSDKAAAKAYLLGSLANRFGQSLQVNAGGTDTEFVGPLRGFKNRLINGAFDIWQRGTSFAAAANGALTADRWKYGKGGTSAVHTVSRSTDAPGATSDGLIRYALLVDCTTADAVVDAGDLVVVQQLVEGNNIHDLVGQPLALSFWVKATKTGTYCMALRNAGQDRSYVAEYTVSASDVWERKTIAIAGGLTTAGTWDYGEGVGLNVTWALMAGATFQTAANAWQVGNFLATANQVNACDSAANNFMLAAPQLERGPAATAFERRAIATEIALCQRYFCKTFNLDIAPAAGLGTTLAGNLLGKGAESGVEPKMVWAFPAQMRAVPTVTRFNPRAGGASGQWGAGTVDSANARSVTIGERQVMFDNNAVTLASGEQFFIGATADAEL